MGSLMKAHQDRMNEEYTEKNWDFAEESEPENTQILSDEFKMFCKFWVVSGSIHFVIFLLYFIGVGEITSLAISGWGFALVLGYLGGSPFMFPILEILALYAIWDFLAFIFEDIDEPDDPFGTR